MRQMVLIGACEGVVAPSFLVLFVSFFFFFLGGGTMPERHQLVNICAGSSLKQLDFLSPQKNANRHEALGQRGLVAAAG